MTSDLHFRKVIQAVKWRKGFVTVGMNWWERPIRTILRR